MNSQQSNKQFPLGNPLANILVIIVGALVVGASLVLGVVAFIALGSLVLVMAAIIGVRLWWMNRRLGKHYSASQASRTRSTETIEVIEGEFHVVKNKRDSDSNQQT